MKPRAHNISPQSRTKSAYVRRPQRETGIDPLVLGGWSGSHSYMFLAALTVLCLLPFSGRAFDADDTLFVWAAKHIVKHPLDPYGFEVVWYTTKMPMWEVTKNPPLGCYYQAMVGGIAGWSERALHLAFLLPALSVILGTYHLAQRFTRAPLAAAAAVLLTPGFLVSSTNVMCDIPMLAIWIVAVIFWLEGLDQVKPAFLTAAGLLIGFCALTKYFGVALIPLLLAYSVARKRRLGNWVWYLFIPILILAGYQYWTYVLYGRGLLWDAAQYAHVREAHQASRLANTMIGFAFIGGCAVTGLTFFPVVWPRKWILAALILAVFAGISSAYGWVDLPADDIARQHWTWLSIQLAFYILGGISILAMAVLDWWKRKDAKSLLLALWIVGTLVFATFLNWTINARSVLPLIPAAGILLARRIDGLPVSSRKLFLVRVTAPLIVSGILSIWIASADAEMANSARLAATSIHEKIQNRPGRIIFQGHWGFQYYMELLGFP
jgi:4-amino-4-deoxy-L-arabinose transferase-like glycosyltransferase